VAKDYFFFLQDESSKLAPQKAAAPFPFVLVGGDFLFVVLVKELGQAPALSAGRWAEEWTVHDSLCAWS
jgi:hypothetical protein